MKKLVLIFLASATSLAFAFPAHAQYVPYPANPGYVVTPTAPQYDPRANQYDPRADRGYSAPYQWRDQRAQEDWRNNTWRERNQQGDWRTKDWRVERGNEDWRQREDYAKSQTRNNAIDRGNVECGVGPAGSSIPCERNTSRVTDSPRENAVDTGSVECGPNSVVESCRSRRQETSPPNPPTSTALKRPGSPQRYEQKQ